MAISHLSVAASAESGVVVSVNDIRDVDGDGKVVAAAVVVTIIIFVRYLLFPDWASRR